MWFFYGKVEILRGNAVYKFNIAPLKYCIAVSYKLGTKMLEKELMCTIPSLPHKAVAFEF